MAIDRSVSLAAFLPNPLSYIYVTWCIANGGPSDHEGYRKFDYDRFNVKERVDDDSH